MQMTHICAFKKPQRRQRRPTGNLEENKISKAPHLPPPRVLHGEFEQVVAHLLRRGSEPEGIPRIRRGR